MVKGTVTGDFLVLSQVRAGCKRELQFVLRSQYEICGGESLGRTRARKNLNVDSGDKDEKTPNRASGLLSRKKKRCFGKDEKDGEFMKSDASGGDALQEDEAKSDVVDIDEAKGDSGDSANRVLFSNTVDGVVLAELLIEDEEREEKKGENLEDNVTEGNRKDVEIRNGHGIVAVDEYHSQEHSPERELHGKDLLTVEEGAKECSSVNGRDDIIDDETEVSCPGAFNVQPQELSRSCNARSAKLESILVDYKPQRRLTRSMLKQNFEGITSEAHAAEKHIIPVSGSDASSSLAYGTKKSDFQKQYSTNPCLGLPSGSSQTGVHLRCVDKKTMNDTVDKQMRRITRSLVKQESDMNSSDIRNNTKPVNLGNVDELVNDVKMVDVQNPFVGSHQKQGGPKRVLRKFPGRLKGFFDSGILEGLTVYYLRGAKMREAGTTGLKGIIKGQGVLCFCSACKGAQVVTPTVYESHAFSLNKRPPEYMVLESGYTLRDIMNACRETPLATLEEKLRLLIGPNLKKSSLCFNCLGLMVDPRDTKALVLCKSCFEVKEQKNMSRTSPPKTFDAVEGSFEPSVVPETILSGSNSTSPKRNIKRRSSRKLPSLAALPNESISCSLKSSSQGRLTRKDLRLHKLVFEDDILPDGAEVGYFVAGKKMLVGYKEGFGIHCSCCNKVVSPSQFEAHAGCASRRKPFQHIYTTNGVSLHELSVALSMDQRFLIHENDDLCTICKDGGELLCCDTCPRSYHIVCASLSSFPSERWSCKYCVNMLLREKFVDSNANAIAAGRVQGVDAIAQITKRCIRIISSIGSALPSVCVLCRGHSFCRVGFSSRTVIICDQCEKEFHVGCLKEHDIADLKELPEGQWFCGSDCNKIYTSLHNLLSHGTEKLSNNFLNFLRKKQNPNQESCSDDNTNLDIRWGVLSGKLACSDETKTLLARVVSILHERFDPISESGTRGDLIPAMVYGRKAKGQDFSGMYCTTLTVNEVIVSVGIFRIFGSEIAELPLVATSSDCQGQGYFQCLFACIQRLLGFLNVKHLVLPAADEAKSIWTEKFGFSMMSEEEVNEYRKDFSLMVFDGTSMLRKTVLRAPAPAIQQKSSNTNHD